MSRPLRELQERCVRSLRRHLEAGDEHTLNEAYEFGRAALAAGVGVLDMALVLWRAALVERRNGADGGSRRARRVESFLLECLSPFEMAHRGAREANEALRRLDERREEEARRIARELHDQAGQLLATVHFALDGVRPHLPPDGEARLARAVELLHEVEDEIRRLSHELRPVMLDDLGLVPALRFLGEGVARRSGVSVTVAGPSDGRLPPTIETALYRVAQEALSNVARHARATRAVLEVQRTEREVLFQVGDDGRGFDPAAVPASGAPGLGLEGIRERIARLGGTLEVSSRPGGGTELRIRVPLAVSHAH